MKKILIPIGALLISGLSQAQLTNTENYVYTKTYLDYNGTTATKTSESVQYFDGLGRPKQVVNIKASPTGKDVVTHIEYDGFGRQVKDYLPVPQQGTQNGGIYTSPLTNATQPTLYGSEKIFSEKILENSPLDRILQQKQVGNAWDTKPVQFGYDANTAEDAVKKYTTVTTWENGATKSVMSQSTNYLAAQLYKNTVTDEDGNQTIEFKNGEGQVLLVRKMLSTTEKVDTYYVYNEYNQLAYVIPPLASNVQALSATDLDNLCYQYRYDSRNRLVEKKLPGKGWEYMLYDRQDRLVATQDTVLKEKGQWLYTKYDQFGRVAITGISTGSDRSTEQAEVNGISPNNVKRIQTVLFNRQGMDVYYDTPDSTYPNSSKWVTLLSLNYYDSYPGYGFNPTFPSSILGEPTLTETPTAEGLSTKSLPVMSLVKNIEDDNWTKNYTYYDRKGRAIGSYSINHLGGRTQVESKLDFAGVVQQSITRHKRVDINTDKVITENFEYDSQNRLTKHYHQVDSQPQELLAENTYNELSQLSNKKVGNNLQSIDYTYNIRGWLNKVNDPSNLNGKLFGYEMKYTNPVYTSLTSGKYNGNIAEIDWAASTENILKRYSYQYDALNRLQKGTYSEPNSSVPQNNFYNEELSYDLNGNIQTLKRNTKNYYSVAEQIDQLSYIYSGNKLLTINDTSMNYAGYPDTSGMTIGYDNNGNMKDHKDKGILNINYNHLNLPSYIQFNNYVVRNSQNVYVNTQYLYRADGVKLKKKYNFFSGRKRGDASQTMEYLDGFQYSYEVNNLGFPLSPNGLQFVPTSEGYYDFNQNKYIYQYKDHLGNMRLAFYRDASGNAAVDKTTDYYPFGMEFGNAMSYGSISPNYFYTYNGKEQQQETQWLDYGARFYMPDIGRWGVVDPLAETSRRWSTYTYAFNNPIRFIDPDGRSGKDWYENNLTKNIEWHDGSDERKGETNLTQKAEGKQIAIIEQDSSGNVLNTNMLNSDGSITRNGETVTNGYSVTTVADRTITSRQPWEAVLNADGGEPGQGGNPGFRFPDYYTANVSIAIPNPLTASFVGWNGTLTVDRNFTVYASPIGVSAGKSAGLFSGSLTANWLNQLKTPTGSQLNNFLSGHGISFGGGNVVGGGVSYSPGNGTATSLGLYTPQLGVSYNYTPDELIFNK